MLADATVFFNQPGTTGLRRKARWPDPLSPTTTYGHHSSLKVENKGALSPTESS